MAEADVVGASIHDTTPDTVLFACTMNSVRSPMAAGILRYLGGPRIQVESVGVHRGLQDQIVTDVMDEIGIDISLHRSKVFADLTGEMFDVVVTLSPEAHHKALEFTRDMESKVEYWPTMDAAIAMGEETETERQYKSYRQVRDQLFARIKSRFQLEGGPTV